MTIGAPAVLKAGIPATLPIGRRAPFGRAPPRKASMSRRRRGGGQARRELLYTALDGAKHVRSPQKAVSAGRGPVGGASRRPPLQRTGCCANRLKRAWLDLRGSGGRLDREPGSGRARTQRKPGSQLRIGGRDECYRRHQSQTWQATRSTISGKPARKAASIWAALSTLTDPREGAIIGSEGCR